MESAVILAGGRSVRMGRNKALLDFGGETIIERLRRILGSVFQEVLISANDADIYAFLDAPIIGDIFEGGGSLAGIHAGLSHCRGDSCFFLACDMPFVDIRLIRHLNRYANDYDIVIPVSRNGLEPLHSFYSRRCLPYIEDQLRQGNLKIIDFFHQVRVREVSIEELKEHDPEEISYFNINTQEKYDLALARLRS